MSDASFHGRQLDRNDDGRDGVLESHVRRAEEWRERGGRGHADGHVAQRPQVQAEDDAQEEASANGTIRALAGTCPALSFAVEGKAIVTTASTGFKKAARGALMNGLKVEV